MIKSVLITGANGGLGKESARQLALQEGIEKIYLACRNPEKAEAARLSLEESTGKSVFEVLLVDMSDLDSVRSAVESLAAPIEGLVMNAGGLGGQQFDTTTKYGVSQQFAVNVLGHAVLLDEMLKSDKLTRVAIYSGSEAARGFPKMGMKRPRLENSSVEEFASICDGSFFTGKRDPMAAYAHVKYVAALWMSSQARRYPGIRFVTISPGATSGTEVMNDLPPIMKFMFKTIGPRLLPRFGLMHELEKGAQRYVDTLNDERFESGVFYGSRAPVLTGPTVDQGTIFSDLKDEMIQDNAAEAVHRFIH